MSSRRPHRGSDPARRPRVNEWPGTSGSGRAPREEMKGKWAVPSPRPSLAGEAASGHPPPPGVPQAPPGCAHLSWSSRPSGAVAPITPGGAAAPGKASPGPRAEGARPGATQPGPRPPAGPEPSVSLAVPGSRRVASPSRAPGTGPGAGGRPGPRAGGERAGSSGPGPQRTTERTRHAWCAGATPRGRDAGSPGRAPTSPCGERPPAPGGSAELPAPGPEEEESSSGGRESESGGPGSGAGECRQIRDTLARAGPP